MAKRDNGKKFWNFVGNLQGDKVVWMIVLLLILLSIVAIFSSTPLLAIQQHTTRTAIMKEQLLISLAGLFFIILCYNIRSQRFFRAVSKLGWGFSMLLLIFLVAHGNLGVIKALYINDAWRSISVFGFQVHVFEVVKVAMVMYLSWAVDAYQNKKLHPIFFKDSPWVQKHADGITKFTYVYFPMLSVCVGIMPGSLSSTLFIGGIMFVTILVGGISVKELILPFVGAIALLLLLVAIDKATPKPIFPHLESALARLENNREHQLEVIRTKPRNSIEFQRALDKMKQPMSAKIAVHEGRGILIGKGPGGSTQRYVVPVMFEDYMFSFIIEEYGILGAIVVIFLYISLLARGSMIVRNCDNLFAKTAVAGLVLLITGQAMMHMFINVGIGPLTGQTLPMVSHGNSSFIMFSIAFGIILSISRSAKRKMDKEIQAAQARAQLEAMPADEPDMEALNELNDIEEIDNLE
ncbi:MAG: FtsW/RodA/SpoVE family cell cycle protein [Bacteroidales bacterium]|jgi:cell division protein FtsW|nr:FtsW/RodA/SpoVE family cell cycle protein [Bacteroidales bacterium]MBQ2222067.1 FtsW/RodA/SpoVE family cell cycle protein [Bacteroidales bacterium]MBQ2514978.1 FtsW/RodA/SpoVE family cell cycle protein [Bacteroidales bacterium]MDY6464153.1 FtsW/RodA/SpoVE family cell cycle protein [Bacteroidales bacterium]